MCFRPGYLCLTGNYLIVVVAPLSVSADVCCRPGYCFVALRSAVEFLMTLDGKAVGMSSRDFRR